MSELTKQRLCSCHCDNDDDATVSFSNHYLKKYFLSLTWLVEFTGSSKVLEQEKHVKEGDGNEKGTKKKKKKAKLTQDSKSLLSCLDNCCSVVP